MESTINQESKPQQNNDLSEILDKIQETELTCDNFPFLKSKP
jgi:hypothetical protein